MLIPRTKFKLRIATILFMAVCVIYFYIIGDINTYPYDSFWNRPGNINDHFIYANYGYNDISKGFSFMDNNFGMYWIFSSFDDEYKQLYAHILNLTSIYISAIAYFSICKHLNLSFSSYTTFFLNTSFLYFSILINKEAISIAIILWCILFAMRRSHIKLLLMLAPALVVRQQLAFLVITFLACSLVLSRENSVGLRKIFALSSIILAIASVAGASLVTVGEIMSQESLGDGLTGQIMATAMASPITAPLWVPVRFLLYVYDMYSSFIFIEDGNIDAAKILRIPSLLYIAVNSWILLRSHKVSVLMRDRTIAILALGATCSFASILFNPQINARYGTIILPVVVLFITCCHDRIRKKS